MVTSLCAFLLEGGDAGGSAHHNLSNISVTGTSTSKEGTASRNGTSASQSGSTASTGRVEPEDQGSAADARTHPAFF
eukprot:1750577-Rhodomonas_salina.1